ncbi:hypothetical protein ACOX9X_13240 [Photobacterium leiognathi subsp. mandapamensis]|uniref:hypothetical protein n=1 Tax=Photobacterium leiognathi TaxID=553611 RepID=UPI003BF54457
MHTINYLLDLYSGKKIPEGRYLCNANYVPLCYNNDNFISTTTLVYDVDTYILPSYERIFLPNGDELERVDPPVMISDGSLCLAFALKSDDNYPKKNKFYLYLSVIANVYKSGGLFTSQKMIQSLVTIHISSLPFITNSPCRDSLGDVWTSPEVVLDHNGRDNLHRAIHDSINYHLIPKVVIPKIL